MNDLFFSGLVPGLISVLVGAYIVLRSLKDLRSITEKEGPRLRKIEVVLKKLRTEQGKQQEIMAGEEKEVAPLRLRQHRMETYFKQLQDSHTAHERATLEDEKKKADAEGAAIKRNQRNF
jgi:hypothetical protein